MFYFCYQAARERCFVNELIPVSTKVPTVRLDGSKAAFDKRWGYGALESIKESSPLHGFGKFMFSQSSSLYPAVLVVGIIS